MRTIMAVMGDTLRSLCQRRLFWVHCWSSLAVVLFFAGMGFHDGGWHAFFGLKSFPNPQLSPGTPWEHSLHCWVLSRLARWWVAGGSLGLALFCCASVMPRTLDQGAAALYLPKVRRRSSLLLGRFFGGLVYAGLVTLLVTGGLFLAAGLRMGQWLPQLFWNVPLALLLFAPLYGMSMLLGVVTRSSTAALLVALLFAGSVWALHSSVKESRQKAALLAAGVDHDDEDKASGLSESLGGEIMNKAAVVLPDASRFLDWQEEESCPRPAVTYRDLFRRMRPSRRGAPASGSPLEAVPAGRPPEIFTDILTTLALTAGTVAAALGLLRRRDL